MRRPDRRLTGRRYASRILLSVLISSKGARAWDPDSRKVALRNLWGHNPHLERPPPDLARLNFATITYFYILLTCSYRSGFRCTTAWNWTIGSLLLEGRCWRSDA
jgi:hypothetical protein